MKNYLAIMAIAAVALWVPAGCNLSHQEAATTHTESNHDIGLLAPPPSSLANFYPPIAEGPLYLYRMMNLNNLLVSVINDAMTNDYENALTGLENFRNEYLDIANAVPEWKDYYPAAPLEEFTKAVQSRDPGILMPVIEELGMVCHNCHINTLASVQYKYHWGDFGSIVIEDPFRGGTMNYKELMQYLNIGLTSIGNELKQSQAQEALKQYQAFNTTFQLMKETCRSCHQLERDYYVDEGVQNMIDQLGMILNTPEINPGEVGDYIEAIGTESCFNCHLVHFPASLAKDGWAKKAGPA